MGQASTLIFFFFNFVFFFCFLCCFPVSNVSKKIKKLDKGMGWWILTNPSYSRIFWFFSTWQDPLHVMTHNLKIEPWRSKAEYATSRSRSLSTISNLYEWAWKKHCFFFETWRPELGSSNPRFSDFPSRLLQPIHQSPISICKAITRANEPWGTGFISCGRYLYYEAYGSTKYVYFQMYVKIWKWKIFTLILQSGPGLSSFWCDRMTF